MDKTQLLMYAGIICWASLGLYLFLLGKKQDRLSRRLEALEKSSKKTPSIPTGTTKHEA